MKTGDSIAEARAVTMPVTDISGLNPELDGKVIHASGRAETTDVLVDPFFGVNATAIRLSRKVEYYQWVETARTETHKKVGGSEEKVTTYTYAKEWVSTPVDSSVFRDENYKNVNFAYGNFEDTEDFALSQSVFYKELLDKIGIQMQVFKVGTYKSAVEPFTSTQMSDANREQVTRSIDRRKEMR